MTDYDHFLSATGRQLTGSAIRQMGILVAQAPDMVSFAPGYPDPAVFPWAELREISDALLHSHQGDTLQYGPTRGYAPLLESLVGVVEARGIKTTGDNLIITSGSQQGIDLVSRVFISPGDVVLVELPTFTGGIAAFKNAGANVVGVKLEDDGLSLDDLDAVWQR